MKKRGSLTVWIAEDTRDNWYARKPEVLERGRQLKYTDQAIRTLLTLRLVLKLPLRQTTGFCESLFELAGINLTVPEFSRLSRRGSQSILKKELPSLAEAGYIIIDSTGLKVYGEKEWLENKHGLLYQRKVWRKLHIGVTEEALILSRVMTSHTTNDRKCVEPMVAQAGADLITEVIADVGYSGSSIHIFLENQGIRAIIPPPKSAGSSKRNKPQATNARLG